MIKVRSEYGIYRNNFIAQAKKDVANADYN